MKYLFTFLTVMLVIDTVAQPNTDQKFNANTRLAVASSNGNTNTNASWVVGGSLFILSEETIPVPQMRVSENIDGLRVYPNPAKDRLFISYFSSNESQKVQFKVRMFDLNGRILYQRILKNNRLEIDLISLPSDVYLIKVFNTQGNEIKTYKIVKN